MTRQLMIIVLCFGCGKGDGAKKCQDACEDSFSDHDSKLCPYPEANAEAKTEADFKACRAKVDAALKTCLSGCKK